MKLKAFTVAVGTVALISAGAGVAAASPASPAAAAWRSGLPGVAGEVTAVTGVRTAGTAITTEFAFWDNLPAHAMYVRINGGAWKKATGPSLAKDETVVAAKAVSARYLVAFTSSIAAGLDASRVLVDSAGKWTVLAKFGAPIGNASVLSPHNIWVFGTQSSGKALGVLHFDGKSWKRVAASFYGGGGVSATSTWAISGTVAEHLSGGKWTGTDLAALIPLGEFGFKQLIGVYPASGSTAYAIGDGRAQDAGGPLVVLQFNGHGWKKVASYPRGGASVTAVAFDGNGGLLIGGSAGAGSAAQLLHYAKGSGKLVAESVPGMTSGTRGFFECVANVPGTTVNILGGLAYNSVNSKAELFTSN